MPSWPPCHLLSRPPGAANSPPHFVGSRLLEDGIRRGLYGRRLAQVKHLGAAAGGGGSLRHAQCALLSASPCSVAGPPRSEAGRSTLAVLVRRSRWLLQAWLSALPVWAMTPTCMLPLQPAPAYPLLVPRALAPAIPAARAPRPRLPRTFWPNALRPAAHHPPGRASAGKPPR